MKYGLELCIKYKNSGEEVRDYMETSLLTECHLKVKWESKEVTMN